MVEEISNNVDIIQEEDECIDENTDSEEQEFPDLTIGDKVSDRPSEGVDLTVQEILSKT